MKTWDTFGCNLVHLVQDTARHFPYLQKCQEFPLQDMAQMSAQVWATHDVDMVCSRNCSHVAYVRLTLEKPNQACSYVWKSCIPKREKP